MRALDPQKHKAILVSATKLFLKRGYAETSMDAVAEHAKVTKQTVYAHYRSKDVLFTQMIVALCEGHADPSISPPPRKGPIEKRLFEFGLGVLDSISAPDVTAATRLVISESGRHPQLATFYYESGTRKLVQRISDYLSSEKENFPDMRAESAASYFLGLLKGQYYLRTILRAPPLPSQKEKEAHVREVVKIFLKLYSGEGRLKTQSAL